MDNADPHPERTHEQSVRYIREAVTADLPEIIKGFKVASPLLLMDKFNIIDGFVTDRMHCMDLGIARQFAEIWFSSILDKSYSISNDDIFKMNEFIEACRVPKLLARLCRSIFDRKFWKAREWLNWLLHYSLPLLTAVIGFEEFSKHWELLVQGIFLLMNDTVTEQNILDAENLFDEFIKKTEHYYTKDAMSFNLHQLRHLPKSVRSWGPLWCHSGKCFRIRKWKNSENGACWKRRIESDLQKSIHK